MVPWKLLFIFCYEIQLVFAQRCITPNGVRSQCIPLMECGRLINFLRSRTPQSILPEERQYINGISCHRDRAGNQRVCCAENDLFYDIRTITTTKRTTRMPTHLQTPPLTNIKPRPPSRRLIKSKLPIASKHECGIGIITNRIVGGIETIPGEYPWMALFEYEIPTTKQRSFACGGSLIHRRFVITAAHCVVGPILQVKGELVNIRLGEHNLSTVRDCEYSDGTGACADPVIDVGISLIVSHPNYTDTLRPRAVFNDIALVRLVRNIESTDYIRPICFPQHNMHSPTGQKLTVSGWGRTEKGTSSDVKLKVSVPVVDFRSCQETLRQVLLSKQTQICAGGVAQKDSCRGDSGGPLMVSQRGVMYLEGLVSFGANECGLPGIPGIYTRVNSYIAWIVEIVGAPYRSIDTRFGDLTEDAEEFESEGEEFLVEAPYRFDTDFGNLTEEAEESESEGEEFLIFL